MILQNQEETIIKGNQRASTQASIELQTEGVDTQMASSAGFTTTTTSCTTHTQSQQQLQPHQSTTTTGGGGGDGGALTLETWSSAITTSNSPLTTAASTMAATKNKFSAKLRSIVAALISPPHQGGGDDGVGGEREDVEVLPTSKAVKEFLRVTYDPRYSSLSAETHAAAIVSALSEHLASLTTTPMMTAPSSSSSPPSSSSATTTILKSSLSSTFTFSACIRLTWLLHQLVANGSETFASYLVEGSDLLETLTQRVRTLTDVPFVEEDGEETEDALEGGNGGGGDRRATALPPSSVGGGGRHYDANAATADRMMAHVLATVEAEGNSSSEEEEDNHTTTTTTESHVAVGGTSTRRRGGDDTTTTANNNSRRGRRRKKSKRELMVESHIAWMEASGWSSEHRRALALHFIGYVAAVAEFQDSHNCICNLFLPGEEALSFLQDACVMSSEYVVEIGMSILELLKYILVAHLTELHAPIMMSVPPAPAAAATSRPTATCRATIETFRVFVSDAQHLFALLTTIMRRMLTQRAMLQAPKFRSTRKAWLSFMRQYVRATSQLILFFDAMRGCRPLMTTRRGGCGTLNIPVIRPLPETFLSAVQEEFDLYDRNDRDAAAASQRGGSSTISHVTTLEEALRQQPPVQQQHQQQHQLTPTRQGGEPNTNVTAPLLPPLTSVDPVMLMFYPHPTSGGSGGGGGGEHATAVADAVGVFMQPGADIFGCSDAIEDEEEAMDVGRSRDSRGSAGGTSGDAKPPVQDDAFGEETRRRHQHTVDGEGHHHHNDHSSTGNSTDDYARVGSNHHDHHQQQDEQAQQQRDLQQQQPQDKEEGQRGGGGNELISSEELTVDAATTTAASDVGEMSLSAAAAHGHSLTAHDLGARFEVLKDHVIGRGATSTVYKAWDNLRGRHAACKQVILHHHTANGGGDNGGGAGDSNSAAHGIDVQEEYKMLSLLNHPNIVPVYGFMFHEGRGRIFMEWVPSGSVQSVLQETRKGLRETIVRRYCREALAGLAYLHSRGIVHRDIKPGNMLLSATGEVKLTDFGTSRTLEREAETMNTGTVVGTVPYLAPECVRGLYSTASDIWALGCAALHMVSGRAPWCDEARDNVSLIFKLGSLQEGSHLPRMLTASPAEGGMEMSAELRSFISTAMTFDRHARPTATQLMKHAFLSGQAKESRN